MNPLISIIIPAYNVEKYIKQCIESIKTQTFQNYEVIIVDDGSNDRTLEIIKQNINEKFKIVTQKNSGAGVARNKGISLSKGKYITFMDSDDFLYNNSCLEKVTKVLMEINCDVLTYKMVRYYDIDNKFLEEEDIIKEDRLFKNIGDYLDVTIQNSRLSVSPCDKIIRSEILKKNKVFFNNYAMLEDIDWSLSLYNNIKNIYVLNSPIYVYRKQRVGSTTSYYNQKKIDSCFEIIKKWCEFCQKSSQNSDLYLNYIAYQYIILIASINKRNCSEKVINEIKKYKWLLNYNKNFKVKMSKKVYCVFGYNMMIFVLKIYMLLKNRNVILISKKR